MKRGDVVRLPEGPYGGVGVVEGHHKGVITVWATNGSTGFELVYEQHQLSPLGRLIVGKPYSPGHGGRRLRRVELLRGLEPSHRIDVVVREDAKDAEETRIREIRRLALTELVARSRSTA